MWETKKFTENKFSLINAQFGNMFHSASKKEKKIQRPRMLYQLAVIKD